METEGIIREGQEQEIQVEKQNYTVGSFPSGTLDITENGTHDVKNYENVNVNVPTSSGVEVVDIDLPYTFLMKYLADPSKYGTEIEVTDESDLEFINETINTISASNKPIVRFVYGTGRYLFATLGYDSGDNLSTVSVRDITNFGTGYILLNLDVQMIMNKWYVVPIVYPLQ